MGRPHQDLDSQFRIGGRGVEQREGVLARDRVRLTRSRGDHAYLARERRHQIHTALHLRVDRAGQGKPVGDRGLELRHSDNA